MAPTAATSTTDTPALALLHPELGTTCGLVCPWLWLLGAIVTVVPAGGAGASGASGFIGAADMTKPHEIYPSIINHRNPQLCHENEEQR